MNILRIGDSPSWAIAKLALAAQKYLTHFKFKNLYIHPREVTEDSVEDVKQNLDWADVVHLDYWRTGSQLLETLPELRKKKLMLTHHNQKNLLSYDWKDINLHIVHTRHAGEILWQAGYKNAMQIPYGIDLDYFKYKEANKEPGVYIGYSGRIVPWKGLKEIARACYELGQPLLFMGKMDKPGYWNEIPEDYRKNIDLSYMDCPDDKRVEFYNELKIFVAFSGPDHEEGTLPLHEAMACGVPVVTTPAGSADDMIVDGENGLLTPFGDYEALRDNIIKLAEDEKLREQLRRAGWQTIKTHTEEMMAWEFEKAYHKVFSNDPLVSAIIPAYNNSDGIIKILTALRQGDYGHVEAIVCDDGSDTSHINRLQAFIKASNSLVVKFVRAESQFYIPSAAAYGPKPYGLAKARNKGVIEAAGEYLFFCDSRMLPAPDAITSFLFVMNKDPRGRQWLFGEKGGGKTSFVENFSFIRRDYFVRMGMMNERIEHYGGLSQELRNRAGWQDFKLTYVPEAKATQMIGSHLNGRRREEIIKSKLLLWKLGVK